VNFDLDENQQLLEETLGRFFAKDFDLRRVREVFEALDGRDEALWKQLAEFGIFGIMVPETYGGAGLGLLDQVVVADVLGHAGCPGPFIEHVLAIVAIAFLGTVAQQERWLAPLIAGEKRGTIALADAGGGWFPDAWTMRSGNLSGEKSAVLFAADADVVVVGTSEGFALVDGGAPGVSVVDVPSLDRTRRVASLTFDGAPGELLSGSDTDRDRVIDVGLVLLAADAAGGARRCLELATDYAKTREQFGTTIGHFQAVKHQLADLAVDVLPLRPLVWYAAYAYDERMADASKFAALAKSHTTDAYVSAARRTVELHGGIGYTWECDVQFFLKRAVFDRTFLGAPAVHRERVAGFNGWVRNGTEEV
jgi:alkylation response protein AidB-like acyl-CoA dehydrogenase